MTTSRSNIRVKVDLSRYHRDARRFSWIYVDCTNVWFISHVKQHIADVFGAKEPFHLLLNGNEYLPPSEDVRIIKENELIVVVPGSGTSDTNASTIPVALPGMQHPVIENTVQSMDTSYCKTTMHTDVAENASKTHNNAIADVTAIDATMYHSMREESEMDNSQDAKATDDNITDNFSPSDLYGVPVNKRKRIRRKKTKHQTDSSFTEKINNKPQRVYKKSKSLELSVAPTGKHIHFDNEDDRISNVAENGEKNVATENKERNSTIANQPTIKNSKVANLSTLLALRQCSTPLTFVNKKMKNVSENEFDDNTRKNFKVELQNSPKNVETNEDGQTNGKNDAAKTTEEPTDFTNLNPEKYPNLESVTEINDIIAFKILRIGNEYTPEVSDYIVARTINWCPKKLLFTFEILRGQTQIQTPLGKFSLQDDESESQICDTANFNFSQLIEPRLIYRK